MSTVEDRELLARYAKGDISAREEITRRYMPLARRLARRFQRDPSFDEDLAQVAYVGLLKTIDRYDPDAGEFIALAITNIRGELKRHLRDREWVLRVARPEKERYLAVGKAVDTLTNTLGRSPTVADLAERTGFSREEVVEALDVVSAFALDSVDAPLGVRDSMFTLGDTLGNPDPGFERVELSDTVQPVVDALPERDQQILRLRFVDDLTQSEIATRCGLSQMHVSRLLRSSLNKLASALEDEHAAA